MGHQMQIRAFDTERRQQRRAQNDIRKLPDRRKGQPPFQIILLNSDQRGNDDTAGRKPGQDISSPDIRQKLGPENETDDTQNRENTSLNNRYRMQQGADRRRAIIAAGSQPCSGMTAAFTDPARIMIRKMSCSCQVGAISVVKKPPALKSIVPEMQ